ncbi:uncharacterized protein [Drosophila takahashii]|uniref:uncharacterized protein n=1 Tax=Drosophila takahashii TaxID=29030 RepID=UPI0038996CA7
MHQARRRRRVRETQRLSGRSVFWPDPHPSRHPPAPEGSAVGEPLDSAKRGRDPASPKSGPTGTPPKRSKAAQEEPTSDAEEEQEQTLTRTECVTKLGKLLDELHSLMHEKQVRHINIAMKAMIAEMRKLKSGIEQSAVEPEKTSALESVCCKCSQTPPAGKPVESRAQQMAVVPRKDRAVQTDPLRRVSQQDGITGASVVPVTTAPAAPRNRAKKARPDAPAMPRKEEANTVVVEAPGKSYSDILALVTRREDSQLTDLGAAVTKVLRTARGNILLEVARGSSKSAESMRDSISRVLGDAAEVRALTEESKVCVFDIRNLDAITTEIEIRSALAEQYQLSEGAVSIRSLRPGYEESKTAVFSLPCSMAKEVRQRGEVRIAWTRCRVREREGLPRCFRCLELGHIAIRCKSLVDKSGCCIKCGEPGHKAVACKKESANPPSSSGEANVRPGRRSNQAGNGGTGIPRTRAIQGERGRKVGQGPTNVIVGGDFNAWVQEWGSVSTNARGRAVLEAFASTDVVLLNDGERHTFVRAGAAFIIDLTYVSGAIIQTARWEICDAYTGSDHGAILCSVGISAKVTRSVPRPRKAYRPDTLRTQVFANALDGMAAEEAGGSNEMANRIATTLELACDQSM